MLVLTSVLPTQDTELAWFDRSGRRLGAVALPGSCNRAVLSPDDRTLASDCIDSQSGKRDVWTTDLSRGISSRVAPGAFAVWLPDSRQVAFATRDVGTKDIVERQVNGPDEQIALLKSTPGFPSAFSPDGGWLLLRNPRDISLLATRNNRPAQAIVYRRFTNDSGSYALSAVFSPDGQWLAYESNESGRQEIFVESFGNGPHARRSERWQVSNHGGVQPRWRRDGRELFYLSPSERQVKAVEIHRVATTIEPGVPTALFSVRLSRLLVYGFNVTGDGQRFLVQVLASVPEPFPATVISNWPAMLTKAH